MSKSSLSRGPLYQDSMDSTRVVQPRDTNGGCKVCGIFWKTKNGLVYGGEAEIPASLFASEEDVKFKSKAAFIGFTPYYARGAE